MGEQWPRAFAHCFAVLLHEFFICDYLLMGKLIQAHVICLLVWGTGLIYSSLTRHICRVLFVDVARWCILEVLSHLKMLRQSPELFLVHVLIVFVIWLWAICHSDYRDSLDSLLRHRFNRCLGLYILFVVRNYSLLWSAVGVVWAYTMIVVEGGCSQPGLKARLLHSTLWKCVLLVHVRFGSKWVTWKDELNHRLYLALSFLILHHLMLFDHLLITDLGQFLFLLFLVRLDQSDRAFAAVLLWSIILIFLFWLQKVIVYWYGVLGNLMLALSRKYSTCMEYFIVSYWFPVRVLNVNGLTCLFRPLAISAGGDFVECVFGDFENRKSPICLISVSLEDWNIELSNFLTKVPSFIVRHELMLIQFMFIVS